MKEKKYYLTAAVCALLTVILIALVRTVDVAAIGPAGTVIGLSRINGAVHELTGVNMSWYKLTEVVGYLAILTGLVFAALGCLQLIRRKSLKKVDWELLCLGGLIVALAILYVFFKKVIVNYRPIIMPGDTEPEASFPSSHTMLACSLMGGVMLVLGRYIKKRSLCTALRALCALMIAVMVAGRLVSGVHWFTDIIGGLFISGMLLALMAGALHGGAGQRRGD